MIRLSVRVENNLKNKTVDYMELIARAAEKDKAERGGETMLPEPAGEKAVDYLAVSKAWKEERGRMDNRE